VIRTALVTGANGFVGGHVVAELERRGAQVTALKRLGSSPGMLPRLQTRVVELPSYSEEHLTGAVPEGLDAVFHVAGDASFWAGHAARQLDGNVGVTQRLIAVARRKGARALVFTSTAGALGLQPGVLTEASPITAATSRIGYVRTKHLAEQLVLAATDLHPVVLNPGTIIGPDNPGYWGRVFQMVETGRLSIVPKGQTSFADVAQVARAHVEAVERGASGERFLLGGADATFQEAITVASRLCGRTGAVREAPAFALWLMGLFGEGLALLTRKEPLMTRQGAEYLMHRNRVSSAKAIDRLGYQPVPLEEMLARTHAWYRTWSSAR